MVLVAAGPEVTMQHLPYPKHEHILVQHVQHPAHDVLIHILLYRDNRKGIETGIIAPPG
jgi:polysaccharide deacetylase 2 family uncharacterized protein YibQ